MGLCDSASNNNQNINPKNNLVPKKNLVIENDTTGIFAKYNIENDNIELIKKKNNGYILPTNLARREQIEKYYNIKEKILGEGAYGQVCIGEKDGINFAIKRMKKNKLKDLKLLLFLQLFNIKILF